MGICPEKGMGCANLSAGDPHQRAKQSHSRQRNQQPTVKAHLAEILLLRVAAEKLDPRGVRAPSAGGEDAAKITFSAHS
jgi:hypothetical protein